MNWTPPSYFTKEPESFTEDECISALRDPTYTRRNTGRVTGRLADLQRVRRKTERHTGTVRLSVLPTTRPPDMRNVKYSIRHTWQDFKTKIASGAATFALLYDWLETKGLLPEEVPFNHVIFWALLLAGCSVVVGVWIIHWIEERDIYVQRGSG